MSFESTERHANNFDMLRLVAALFVIITHSYALLGLPETDILYRLTQGTFSFSRLGLSVFFVLSGFLVTQSALRSKGVVAYGAKRAIRILPAYSVVVLFAAFVLGPLVTLLPLGEYLAASQTWAYLKTLAVFRVQYDLPGVFLDNPHRGAVNGSLWTIPYEVALYALPLVFFLHKQAARVLRWPLVAAWLVGAAVHGWWSPVLWGVPLPVLHLNAWFVLHFGLFFIGGMVLALFNAQGRIRRWMALGAVLLLTLSFFTEAATELSYLLLPVVLLWVAYVPWKWGQRQWQRFREYGDISYGMYLYAFPVQQILVLYLGHLLTVPRLALVSMVCTIPFAVASRKWIEMPALTLKHKV